MDQIQRARFNANFTEEKYEALLRAVNESEGWPADFRISETPIFLTPEFTEEITGAARELVAQVQTPEFEEHGRDAIPAKLVVPNENPHPNFLQVDFAVCAGEDGRLTPQLIELQGFPSLYSYQLFFWRCLRATFPEIPPDWQPFFSGHDEQSYRALLRSVIVGEADPENVVLLEIEPERQKTRIDFACPESVLGVRPVCLTSIIKRGRQLFTGTTAARSGSSAFITGSFSTSCSAAPSCDPVSIFGKISTSSGSATRTGIFESANIRSRF